jgi:transposase InsO family protein
MISPPKDSSDIIQETGSGLVPAKFLEDLTVRLSQLILQNQQSPSQPPPILVSEGSNRPIAVMFNGKNYGLWSQMVEVHLKSRDKIGYVNGEKPQPNPTDPGYDRWQIEDSTVKGWLLNSLDPGLLGNFFRFNTAKGVWDAIGTAFFDGSDRTQVYELKLRVQGIKQMGGSLEDYFNTLQSLWREIDFRRPNKNICPKDIENRNEEMHEDRLYTFLGGLDNRFDSLRGEILRMNPLPSMEETFAMVRREDTRQSFMAGKMEETYNPMAMVANGVVKSTSQILNSQRFLTEGNSYQVKPVDAGCSSVQQQGLQPPIQYNGLQQITCQEGLGYGGFHQNSGMNQMMGAANYVAKQKQGKVDKNQLMCSNCGNRRHTKENCFKLNGYPDWWAELKKKKLGDAQKAKVTLVTAGKSTNDDEGMNICLSNLCTTNSEWIIDSGATDHMTFDETEIKEVTKPRKKEILNANGVAYPVSGSGNIQLSKSLTLTNALVVPSLSTKLISVGQLADELNCVVMMYPNFCVFQNILTKEIIGRGIRKGRLYHLEDMTIGQANIADSDSKRISKIWMWHKRLGHPSFSYMSKLLPSLFSDFDISTLHCETCIQAKSHRVSYKTSLSKCNEPIVLIHSDVWGPSPVSSICGYKWFVLFIDDCTRMIWIYLLKGKEEVGHVFKNFLTMIQNQFGKNIKYFRSDNGGEFLNRSLKDCFINKGIIHETSCVGTPQQNGIVERKNRHILETARALLLESRVSQNFWDSAVLMAVYLINRLP